ncbi:MAG: efflux RND transporter periplasmic adaptor subunit, partial [Phycisphaerae bacterium]|nr:efflux RND transporter periplasmic adaptor subunit [Phycisphaerae bacterium]
RPEDAPVLSVKVVKKSFSVLVEAVGELDAERSTVLFSQIRGGRGTIVSIISDGTRVKKDDVLVRLDPTSFEEEVTGLTAKVREWEAVVSANEQILEWEKVQSERETKTLEFDLRAARLDLIKLEKGEGPLELYRLEGAAQKAKQDWKEKEGYLVELKALEKRGYANIAEIAQTQNKVSEAKQAYEVAKRQHESYRDYVLPSLIENAHAQVARANMNLEQFKKGTGFKIGKAMAALRKAQQSLESTTSSLKIAQAELERTVIRAPIPGIAVLPEAFRGGIKRKPRIGDIAWQNQPLVYLPDVSGMVVKTQIREIDLHKVGAGKKVMVFVDAYPDLRLSGDVQSIGVLAESRTESHTADKYFQVVVSVREKDQRLRPGMTARVEIECTNVENALSVPVHAVFNDQGRTYCYVDTQASYEKREVAIGAQSENWAQVLAGLKEGERVALSQPPSNEIRKRSGLSL